MKKELHNYLDEVAKITGSDGRTSIKIGVSRSAMVETLVHQTGNALQRPA
jgi:hypothetical protein